MTQTIRSPFEGKPATRQVADVNGNPAFLIEPRILTPLRVTMVNLLSGVAAVGLFISSLGSLAGMDNPDSGSLMAALTMPLLGGAAVHALLKAMFRKRVKLMMTLERFSIRGLFGWKHYDRLLPHRFAVLPHDWQQAERDQDEYRMQ